MKVTPGISFAIPIDYAKEFLNNSREKRLRGNLNQHKKRRFLGITMLPITSQIIGELRSRMHIPAHVVNGIVVYRIGMSIFHFKNFRVHLLKLCSRSCHTYVDQQKLRNLISQFSSE